MQRKLTSTFLSLQLLLLLLVVVFIVVTIIMINNNNEKKERMKQGKIIIITTITIYYYTMESLRHQTEELGSFCSPKAKRANRYFILLESSNPHDYFSMM